MDGSLLNCLIAVAVSNIVNRASDFRYAGPRTAHRYACHHALLLRQRTREETN